MVQTLPAQVQSASLVQGAPVHETGRKQTPVAVSQVAPMTHSASLVHPAVPVGATQTPVVVSQNWDAVQSASDVHTVVVTTPVEQVRNATSQNSPRPHC